LKILQLNELLHTLNCHDEETFLHSIRVSYLFQESVKYFNLFQHIEEKQIIIGSLLHDIGKIMIPKEILNKADKLSKQEWEVLKYHPVFSHSIVKSIYPFKEALEMTLLHHERWDGKGYYYGYVKNNIPAHVQLLSVIDAYDAMTSNRSYRNALTLQEAKLEIIMNSGTQFSPEYVDLFIKLPEYLLLKCHDVKTLIEHEFIEQGIL
jgi:HD-GYP domain-containing protein (c-di-GMP phosphodiesterase class II)